MKVKDFNVMTIKDEVLSAYLDGELSPEEAARVEALLAHNPKLGERLARLRLAGELAREAFAPIGAAIPALSIAAGVNWRRHAAPVAAAIAACAVGVVLGLSMRGDGASALFEFNEGVLVSPAMTHVLDQTPSGARTRRGAVELVALYSFRDEEGRACRVFRASVSGVLTEAAACRDGERWRVLALAPVRAVDGFMQADSAEPEAVAAAVDGVFAAEIDAAAEAELISRDWRE